MKKKSQKLLAIETSCDETGAAVYDLSTNLKSNVVFSQIYLHKEFGGVIPEVASRSQLEKINLIVQQALNNANLELKDIDAVAVTHKPGLPGSLLVGLCFAKSLAYAQRIPLIGVNHLDGHVFSSFLEHVVPFPHLCLTASGGHSSLYKVNSFTYVQEIATTQDDAAGEAFDKIAKLMNLSYPGGPIIEKLAQQVNFIDFFNYPRGKKDFIDFSFSGLKTAVLYDLVKKNAYDMQTKTFLADNNVELKQQVASSLLVCIKDIFINKISLALKQYPEIQTITFVGGVACNNYLKQKLLSFADKSNIQFYTPSRHFCTDNAAMIAFVGAQKLKRGNVSPLTLDIF
jgi:N6-L-threonylcarbamoyladenine synthase